MGRVWQKKRIEELINDNLYNEKTIVTKLVEEKFRDKDIESAIEDLKKEGKITS